MNKKIIKTILVLVGLGLIYVLYYTISPLFNNIKVDDELPEEVVSSQELEEGELIRSVPVIDTPLHPASGTVRLVETEDARFVRYENYKTINGPDLFVYLATDLEATEYIDLGVIRGTEGNINYQIPEGVDLAKYRYVLTWCKEFGVLFNSADLSSL